MTNSDQRLHKIIESHNQRVHANNDAANENEWRAGSQMTLLETILIPASGVLMFQLRDELNTIGVVLFLLTVIFGLVSVLIGVYQLYQNVVFHKRWASYHHKYAGYFAEEVASRDIAIDEAIDKADSEAKKTLPNTWNKWLLVQAWSLSVSVLCFISVLALKSLN